MTAESALQGDFFNAVNFSDGVLPGIWAVMIDSRQRFNRLHFNFIFFFGCELRQILLRYGNVIDSISLGNQFAFKRDAENRHSAWNIPLQARYFPHMKRYLDKRAAALGIYGCGKAIYHMAS